MKLPIVTIQYRREKLLQITQRELAQRTGVSLDFIKRFENGRSYREFLENIEKIAREFGCDPRDVVLFCDEMVYRESEEDLDGLIEMLLRSL
ncbi:MAG: helix-turn-helix transcriptional regulator [Cyanobacteria bacterium SBLK]|nr:helix-turn-helix transcriptional regulator [Cyanobacteria bacterium SBLK]